MVAAGPLDYFAEEVCGAVVLVVVLGDVAALCPCVEVLAGDGDSLLCEHSHDDG